MNRRDVNRRALDRDLDRARALTRDRARDLDRARARALTRVLDLDLAHALPRDRDLTRDFARDLARALDRARDRALDLTRDLDRARHARDLDLAQHARDLGVIIERASNRARLLERSLQEGASTRAVMNAPPGRVSRGLVALAVRTLPVRDRRRYQEEFRTELVELRRRHRLGYALRVLSSAWQLRRALIESVRTADGAPARRATER